MITERWNPEQKRLHDLLLKINVGDVIECPGLNPAECREVAYSLQNQLMAQDKRFVSVKLQTRQAVKRIA